MAKILFPDARILIVDGEEANVWPLASLPRRGGYTSAPPSKIRNTRRS